MNFSCLETWIIDVESVGLELSGKISTGMVGSCHRGWWFLLTLGEVTERGLTILIVKKWAEEGEACFPGSQPHGLSWPFGSLITVFIFFVFQVHFGAITSFLCFIFLGHTRVCSGPTLDSVLRDHACRVWGTIYGTTYGIPRASALPSVLAL